MEANRTSGLTHRGIAFAEERSNDDDNAPVDGWGVLNNHVPVRLHIAWRGGITANGEILQVAEIPGRPGMYKVSGWHSPPINPEHTVDYEAIQDQSVLDNAWTEVATARPDVQVYVEPELQDLKGRCAPPCCVLF